MFSLSCIQVQTPSLSDIQLSNLVKSEKHFHRRKGYNGTSYTFSQNSLGFYPNNVAFSTHCHSHSTSPKNVDVNENEFYSDAPINQSTDSKTLGNWLQACSSAEETRKVHAIIVKCTKNPVIYVYNNLISAYIKSEDLVAASKVFDNMLDRNVVSWTAMLNGYLRFGFDDEAQRLFSEFVEYGFQGNSKTYVCALNLCSRTFNYELGKQLHACIIKGSLSNLILDSAILYFYAQCSTLADAFRVFNRMTKWDVISWTSMITVCSQHRQGQEAFFMLSRMLADGLEPNEFTVCSILNACGEEKELKFGRQFHGVIVKKAFHMDVFIGTSLVDMYAKCGEIGDSRALFDEMKRKNTVTWTSIIAGYARNGLGEEAIRLFRMMKRLKIFPNNLTVVSILRACGLLRALSTGKELHAQILKNFAPSNIYIGSALVWLYCKCGEYYAASKVLQYMPDRDVVSWTTMISGCAHLGHEYEALEYLKKMLREEAVQVFDNMPDRNLVSWKAMIVAYAKKGLCGEALKLMYRMQAEGIEVDDYILSTILTSCGNFEWDMEPSSEHCLQP
ncbi:Pentatricopeptide repeat-containing protein [Abeliophyllum distichum]|uniref:Pentatricopeptide repeat-containing protein n=1 Tax=Abeliophyllum distichum TaxID=126358 RepID=A0ABD1Q5W1_9LAMI